MFDRKCIYIFVSFLCTSLLVRGQEVTAVDLDAQVKSFHINEKINPKHYKGKLKTIILDHFAAHGGNDTLKFHDIDSIQYQGTYKLKNIGEVLVFQIYFSHHLPAVWHYQMVLLIDNKSYEGYLFNLDTVTPVKVKQSDNEFYFAGIYKNRYQYGTFKIFEIKNGVLYNIFVSNEAVSNYSLDCISYENDELKFQNIDMNQDGYLDLVFTGIKNYYCEGYELYGREERAPIKQEKISIVYYYFVEKNIFGWKK